MSLVYQPIVELDTNRVAGFEALMRWEHPRRGDVSPAEFIPLAEASGLINQLGLFALERVVADFMQWQQVNGDLPIFVSVNLSSAQLINANLYDDFRSVLAKTRCEPQKIKLELTESVVMENPEQSRLILAKLKESGFSLALDDFGTGYSALNYLTRFPFDTVKIDRSLVTRQDTAGQTVLASVISMIRELGMTAVAEGIETEEAAAKLFEQGCALGQSYLFGPPITADMAQRLLKEKFPLIGRN
jgi:EAL domain-containing protein (putative c-di-GMP-specific phosphodiesterase class I)